ncbi:MAG: ribonuclease III [Verrucomicrobia bacterium]|nr:ribonuclease III [Verrucomicrobiota bacterium]
MSEFAPLEAALEYRFRNSKLLLEALTHPSLVHEQGGGMQHNQRMEFLGDAVLQLVLTRELYEKFPLLGEGPLTQARAQLVNRRTLAKQAEQLRLGNYLRMSRGEELSGGRQRASAMADAFEALLGAIYLDGGFDVSRTFVLRQFRETFGEMDILPNLENPKGDLQEMLQSEIPEPPRYQMLSTSGPDHDRVFECEVSHRGIVIGRGAGKSKKAAEASAALAALAEFKRRAASPGDSSSSPDT